MLEHLAEFWLPVETKGGTTWRLAHDAASHFAKTDPRFSGSGGGDDGEI